MKKLFFTLLISALLALSALADDTVDILAAFDKYVNEANNYSSTLPNYYVKNAKIVRVVNKKGGGQKAVVIPYDRYLKELQNNQKLAKMTAYKNKYINRKVTKVNNDYKLSATRIPRNDKTGLGCYFIYTKTPDGWKIKEESMTTNVQTFLSAK